MIRGLLSTPRPVNWARRCSAMVGIVDCGGDYAASNERIDEYLSSGVYLHEADEA